MEQGFLYHNSPPLHSCNGAGIFGNTVNPRNFDLGVKAHIVGQAPAWPPDVLKTPSDHGRHELNSAALKAEPLSQSES